MYGFEVDIFNGCAYVLDIYNGCAYVWVDVMGGRHANAVGSL
jgi:hypothetical protein